MMLIYASELGGLSSTLPSDLDPFLARLGIGTIGNAHFSGTIRTALLNGYKEIKYDKDRCVGCLCCLEICPQGCWETDTDNRAAFCHKENCTACCACVVQCETHAISTDTVQ